MLDADTLIAVEKEAMTTAGRLVWSLQDVCMDLVRELFRRPAVHSGTAKTEADPDPEDPLADTGESLLKRYYDPSLRQVTTFTETVLYSIIIHKWAHNINDNNSDRDGDKEDAGIVANAQPVPRLPPELRRVVRNQAVLVLQSLLGVTSLKLEALHHMCAPLARVEQAANRCIERRGDRIAAMEDEEEQRREVERLEGDAVQYVSRQMLIRLDAYRKRANEELYDTMRDALTESIENGRYHRTLHAWAAEEVRMYRTLRQQTMPREVQKHSHANADDETRSTQTSTAVTTKRPADSFDDASWVSEESYDV